MDNTSRFEGKSEIYDKARSKYAPELFGYIRDVLKISDGSIFADIGSGTGIFTEQLILNGYRVYAVEPNSDMRKKAEKKLLSNELFTSIDGRDSETHLPDSSVDMVTAAQAFHWFNADGFKRECRRILRTGGRVMLVYNSRDEKAECAMALAELRRKYNPEFHGFGNGISEEDCIAFFEGGCNIFRADNSCTYDRNGYIERALSSSYSLREGDPLFSEYLNDIGAIFDRFSFNGRLTVPVNTVAYVGEV